MTNEILPLIQILSFPSLLSLSPFLIFALFALTGNQDSLHIHSDTTIHTHTHIWLTLQRSRRIYGCWVSCVILMSAVAHKGTLKPTPDRMTEGPNYHSHGRERERKCVVQREQREEAHRERHRYRVERRSACACMIQT